MKNVTMILIYFGIVLASIPIIYTDIILPTTTPPDHGEEVRVYETVQYDQTPNQSHQVVHRQSEPEMEVRKKRLPYNET